jgi:hypothetical protein
VGDGSPGSREAEGEGGEGFYIAQSGRCSDLLVFWGGGTLFSPTLHVSRVRQTGFTRTTTGIPLLSGEFWQKQTDVRSG